MENLAVHFIPGIRLHTVFSDFLKTSQSRKLIDKNNFVKIDVVAFLLMVSIGSRYTYMYIDCF